MSTARRAAAGGCVVRSAERPHCGAAINSPRRGAQRGAADGRAARLRLLPPPPAARAHTRGWRGASRRRRGAVSHTALGTSCWGLSQTSSEASRCPGTSSQVLHPSYILIPKGPYHRSLQLLVFPQPAGTPSASPSRQDLALFLRNYSVIKSWSPSL